MAKKSAEAIEFVSSFQLMGSIKKMETFSSKGGGIKFIVETGEKDIARDLIDAEGAVVRVTIEKSTAKISDPLDDDQAGLEFSETSDEGAGD